MVPILDVKSSTILDIFLSFKIIFYPLNACIFEGFIYVALYMRLSSVLSP